MELMNKRTAGRTLFMALGSAVLVLTSAACGGSPRDAGSGESIVSDGSGNTQAATVSDYEEIPDREPTPLDEYLNLVGGWAGFEFLDPDEQRRVFEANQVIRENFVAECMNDLGFDYIPNLQSIELRLPTDNDEWRPREREWVAQWGYAFASRPASVGSLTRDPIWVTGGQDERAAGPNWEMLQDMSESEQHAWWQTLWGTEFADHFGYSESGALISHCFNWAGMQATAQQEIASNEEFTPLMEAVNELRNSFREDISPADQAWSECMADKGFPNFERQWEPMDQINTEYNDLASAIRQNPDRPGGVPSAANSPEMAEFADHEIKLALADFDCRVSTNFAAGQQAYVLSRETQFVSDHRAALTALRDAAEQR
jgi:hypothetical protein